MRQEPRQPRRRTQRKMRELQCLGSLTQLSSGFRSSHSRALLQQSFSCKASIRNPVSAWGIHIPAVRASAS